MQFEPIKLVDSIVRGTILASYDFIRLTFFGLAFASVRRTRRFWPSVVALTGRLSPLTFLFLWIFIAAGLYIQPNELTQIVLKGISSDTYVIIILICAFVLTVVIDLVIRLGCRFMAKRTRRALYESLFRVAAAILYLGAVVILFLPRLGLPGFDLFRFFGLAHLEFGLFALPLGVIATKAVRAKRQWTKVAIMVGAYLIGPFAVQFTGLEVFFPTYFGVTDFFKPAQVAQEGPRVFGHYLRCEVSENKTRVTGYLNLQGQDFMILTPHNFHIWYTTQIPFQEFDLGRPDDESPNIVLTVGALTKLVLEATPALNQGEQLPGSRFPCSLVLHMSDQNESQIIPFFQRN